MSNYNRKATKINPIQFHKARPKSTNRCEFSNFLKSEEGKKGHKTSHWEMKTEQRQKKSSSL